MAARSKNQFPLSQWHCPLVCIFFLSPPPKNIAFVCCSHLIVSNKTISPEDSTSLIRTQVMQYRKRRHARNRYPDTDLSSEADFWFDVCQKQLFTRSKIEIKNRYKCWKSQNYRIKNVTSRRINMKTANLYVHIYEEDKKTVVAGGFLISCF